MSLRIRRRLVFLLVMGFMSPVHASPGLDALDYFFNEINTFEARFGQIVLDESLNELDNSEGQMWIQRPGLFRWNYEPPEAQEIVGDGENVWIYDV